jgi:hypothetical protein
VKLIIAPTVDAKRLSSTASQALPGVRCLNIGRVIEPYDKRLHSNVVITSRYNIFTFLPINLFEQVLNMNV